MRSNGHWIVKYAKENSPSKSNVRRSTRSSDPSGLTVASIVTRGNPYDFALRIGRATATKGMSRTTPTQTQASHDRLASPASLAAARAVRRRRGHDPPPPGHVSAV
jgi:hypothetical protein